MSGDMVFGDDGFDVEIGGGAVESAAELHSGNRLSKEGWFHFVCSGAEHKPGEDTKLRHMIFDLTALDGSADLKGGASLKDQAGKITNLTVYLESWDNKEAGTKKPISESAAKNLRSLGLAFGLIREDQLPLANLKINFAAANGRQVVAKASRDDDWTDGQGNVQAGRIKVKWASDVYPVYADKVKNVPKDPEYLGMLNATTATNLDDI